MKRIEEADKEFIRKAIEISNKGYYMAGNALTQMYNKILEKNVPNTNCSACLKSRVYELEKALRRQEAEEAKERENKAAEDVKKDEVINYPQDKKEANTKQIKEENKDATIEGTPEKKSSGKRGRKKRTE